MANFQIIALMDCDSFFVSCEQLDNPSLLGKPVCVLSNNDGCIISRSKEAKKMGVRMGMPLFMAKKEYPNAIYISGRYNRYVEISKRTMLLLKTFSPNVEQYSIDEAFIDLTGLRKLYRRSYIEIAKMIREEIKAKIGIPVSIGVSTTKTLAKLASHRAKEQNCGEYIIGFRSINKELKDTPLSEVWGVGRNTAALMAKYGINNAYEFSYQNEKWLQTKLGIRGLQLKAELLGTAISKIASNEILPKSIQNTRSFASFTSDKEYIKNSLIYHINISCRRLRELKLKTGCVRVLLRTKDFKYFSQKEVLVSPTAWDSDITNVAVELFDKIYSPNVIYRSSGIVLENLIKNDEIQISIFDNLEEASKKERLGASIDKLTKKYKKEIIKIGYAQSPRNN